MKRIRIRRPSPALVIACLALLIALWGTGYAALVLPANSVGTAQLKSGGITLTSKPGVGEYILDFGSVATGHLIVASSGIAGDVAFRGTVSAGPCGGTGEGFTCPSGNDTNHVVVFTDNPGENATQDHSFYVAVLG